MTITLMALLALILPCLILAAWTLERRERNEQLADLRADQARERDAWQADRRELLNRIKPETTQYAPATPRPEQPQVRFDDDDSYWAATTNGMSKEELAEAVDAAERQMQPFLVPGEAVG